MPAGDVTREDLEGERLLAAAVFTQAMRDVRHRPSRHDKGELRRAHVDALTWIEDAGQGFAFWVTIVGREPCRLRTSLLSRIGVERVTQVRADRAEHEGKQRRGRYPAPNTRVRGAPRRDRRSGEPVAAGSGDRSLGGDSTPRAPALARAGDLFSAS